MTNPVETTDDVLKTYPKAMQLIASAPVRDAIVAAQTAMFQFYQTRSDFAISQVDPLQATDIYLDGLGTDDRGIVRGQDVTDSVYRAQFFVAPDLVCPEAIVAAVTAITSQFSTILPQYIEASMDCAFIDDVGNVFVQDPVTAPKVGPRYLNRLYEYDASSNYGYKRPQSNPGGLWVFDDQLGRRFLIRIPALDAADDAMVFTDDTGAAGPFISDGTDPFGSESSGLVITFVYGGGVTADDLYKAIVSVVQQTKAQGFRFEVFVDPMLTT